MTPASSDRITVRGIRATGHHGVYAEERADRPAVRRRRRAAPRPARRRRRATTSPTTVHYGELARRVVAAIEGDPVDLVETLARRLADIALSYPVVDGGRGDRAQARSAGRCARSTTSPSPSSEPVVTAAGTEPVRRVVLSLGSNLGDRLEMLQGAVDALADTPALRIVGVSPVYETDPVGGPEQADYLNAVLVAEGPHSAAHAARARAGRRERVRPGPRRAVGTPHP